MTPRTDPATFWTWFREHERLLRPEVVAAAPTGEVMRELDRRVRALGVGLTWEVGPGLEREGAFVLSPGGVRERLVVTDAVVVGDALLAWWSTQPSRVTLMLKVRSPMR